ncbi:hypothetical protein K431DRAFT_65095 [Polychaeton citri CBS 116435]|uniref:Uncharacterized protein n=1 Tax=Polychaeton citri CBS 116435 TaxID=1314669 RepID=A0A9P4Q766_9PEZI|nr:hypothetical protein K431DRAFT_65095 [Polychaeton citri CBS 116435]
MTTYWVDFQRSTIEADAKPHCPTVPSKRNDLIQSFINSAIEAYQLTSFAAFQTEIRAYPLRSARDVINSDGQWIGFDRYLFEVYGGEVSPLSRPIKLNIGDRQRQVWVRLKRKRMTVYGFLHALPKAKERDLSTLEGREHHLDRQARWWSMNQKVFQLLDLPAEIREVIYQHVLETKTPIVPFVSDRDKIQKWDGKSFCPRQAPNINVLKVNKQLNSEAAFILYKYGTFQVVFKLMLCRVLMKKGLVTNIRNLELKLSHYEFFRVFGYKFGTHTIRELPPSLEASSLRTIHLEKLIISFNPPSLVTQSMWLDDACQVAIVGCIFEGMWPWIKGHPTTFNGYLKAWQKAAFEQRCTAEYQAVQEWQHSEVSRGQELGFLIDFDRYDESTIDQEEGGVMLDGRPAAGGPGRDRTSGFEGSMESVKLLPPPCYCNPRCTVGVWRP